MEQHFLRSPEKIRAVVAAAGVRPQDRVVELGAGIGSIARRLPRCRALTLVDLDSALARDLAVAFPRARVIRADAVTTLPTLQFDVVLTNLPHSLTAPIINVIAGLPFRVAVLAVRAGEPLAIPPALRATEVAVLEESDFEPPQPFASQAIRVVRVDGWSSG
jgi:16S rRNA A1518/A1519 N6-dimethyltransferase RsmA/KsgA/DIM1 with predicted DNA glycosylase/AP lyase activity